MAKRPITIQLEPDLIERIDGVRGKLARQEWIADACREALSPRAPEMSPAELQAFMDAHRGIYTLANGELIHIGDEEITRRPSVSSASSSRPVMSRLI